MPSTLVSLAVRDIHEEIPGMMHAAYDIPASVDGHPSILVINDSFYYKPDIDGNQDRILVASSQIAHSIVHMHTTSQLLYNANQHPAIMAIPDKEVDADLVLHDYAKDLKELLKKQRQWFRALVQLADDDWQQLRRHNMISDIQRTAAKELGLKREWLDAVPIEERINCPFCGSTLFDPQAPICPICGKVHNPAKLAELEKSLLMTNPITGRKA